MSKRVFVVLLFVAALFAGRPTLATTLTVNWVNCYQNGGGNFACDASVSGGTGTYTSYSWVVTLNHTSSYQRVTTVPELFATCWIDKSVHVTVTVTDSAGATASGSGGSWCTREAQ